MECQSSKLIDTCSLIHAVCVPAFCRGCLHCAIMRLSRHKAHLSLATASELFSTVCTQLAMFCPPEQPSSPTILRRLSEHVTRLAIAPSAHACVRGQPDPNSEHLFRTLQISSHPPSSPILIVVYVGARPATAREIAVATSTRCSIYARLCATFPQHARTPRRTGPSSL